jgi:alpha-galactosidase
VDKIDVAVTLGNEMGMIRKEQNVFVLEGKGSAYLLGIAPDGDIHHLYWGTPLGPEGITKLAGEWVEKLLKDPKLVRENHLREFADFGHNDLRVPALHIEQSDGSRLSRFVYCSHEITEGKPELKGLPGTTVNSPNDAQTLKLVLEDKLKGHQLELFYTLYPEWDALVRRAALKNNGPEPVHIQKLMSASLDFPAGDYRLTSFSGAWIKERQKLDRDLLPGTTRLESRKGQSSHEMNPFAMVSRGMVDEEKGEVYGFALAYSGNWLMEAEVYRDKNLRIQMGLNDFDLKWRLEPGENFQTPECVMVYSDQGHSSLSLKYHRFIRRHVLRGAWKDKVRPILINNWEATYFDFKHEDILRIAKNAKELGIELMVLDDGWFGKRDKDDSSLGDWFEDKAKLPRGIQGLADEIHGLGMKFGLWFEPEMVSPKSRLYEQHPDWCLHVPGRDRNEMRNQLVLDMGRAEVRDYLFKAISKVLEEGKVDYVKWDMNRPVTEAGSAILPPNRQAQTSHRHILGVYDLMERLNRRFPQILFEGCAGGGGRFDLGILSYHPQIWASDNTDGLDRIFIQYGTSFCYPPITHGSHVSASPNHQTKRETPLKWRHLVAMSGNLGYEVDVSKWTDAEKKEAAGFIRLYKEIAPLIQFGDYYRLESPYGSDRASWSFVNEARTEAVLFVFQINPPKSSEKPVPIRLRGLDPTKKYRFIGMDLELSGENLMDEGWAPSFNSDGGKFQCGHYRLVVSS